LFLDTKQTNPPSLIFAHRVVSPQSGEPFCGARPRGGRAEQCFQTTKFLLAVIFYTLREPFLNETAIDSPRRRSRTRVCKNQEISLHFPRASSPHPSAAKRKKRKGDFWFCFAVLKI